MPSERFTIRSEPKACTSVVKETIHAGYAIDEGVDSGTSNLVYHTVEVAQVYGVLKVPQKIVACIVEVDGAFHRH